jgi:hypothetical protein
MSRKILTVFAVMSVVIGAFAIGPVLASHDVNTVHGCVNDQSGTLRVVADPSDCRQAESALDWNVQGVAGQDGADGQDGAQGPAGQDGAQGPAGQDGADGQDGAQGPAGGAVAYAHVNADGTIDHDSGNIVVSRPNANADGRYCIGVVGATVHVAVASLDSRKNVGGSVQTGIFHASGCPSDASDIFVVTRDHDQDGGVPGDDKAFYIIVN